MPEGGRRGKVLALASPVLIALVVAAAQALAPGTARETPCWVFPNLRVLPVPGDAGCPVEVGDAIRRLRGPEVAVPLDGAADLRRAVAGADGVLPVWLERRDRPVAVALPVRTSGRAERLLRLSAGAIAVGLLLSVPYSLLLHARAAAALPLAVFYTAFALLYVGRLAGWSGAPASLAALACLCLAPGALLHLAFSFPRESRLRQEAPAILALPYALSAFLVLLGAFAVWRTPTLWPAFLYVLLAVCGAAWTVLILACAFGVRETPPGIERTRARVVLFGSLLLPVLPATALALHGGAEPKEWPALYLWSAVVTMPLPIALAISRYNLFDLGFTARRSVARMLSLGVTALTLAGGAWLAGPWLDGDAPGSSALLALAFGCALLLEPLRARLPRTLERLMLPRLEALRAARSALEASLPTLEDEADILACAERALAALGPRRGAIFRLGVRPRLVHAFGLHAEAGGPVFDRALAAAAVEALAGARLLQLAAEPRCTSAHAKLSAAGVALAASIESGGERVGLLLLGQARSGAFDTGIEVDFAASVARLVGDALLRAGADERRRSREWEAAADRLALALAHDTGKDLVWLKLLARRLASHAEGSFRVRRDAEMIAALSEELATTLRGLLDESPRASTSPQDPPRLDDVVAGVVHRMDRLYGPGRIVDVIDPALRRLRCPALLGRVLSNLVDNALQASSPGDPVHVSVAQHAPGLRLRVEDRGCGIPDALRARVFQPGVTTRASGGGSGIGLTVARDIAEMLGGSIQVAAREGRGTVATVDLPLDVLRGGAGPTYEVAACP